MRLYHFFRSSAAYRIRIALNLKGVEREQVPVDLLAGEQSLPGYREANPQGMVPALDIGHGAPLTQSLAILEYLEERFPEPPMLPRSAEERARVRAMAQIVVSDIHPLVTLRVMRQLSEQFQASQAAVDAWLRHWMHEGFTALEQMIGDDGHCFGGRTTLADVCLVPQVVSARHFGVPLDPFPRVCKVADLCGSLPAFAMAHPSRQPEAGHQ
ncbi:maleylacetoacetate isomerase [Rhodoligotrophos defluvii]|uniref:maleylacetoacetate isomerase n=1 Tax=Rhodoligotrophos defluvii TaxID=2561934 RepID=UPI0010C95A9D|nr:maleylacetoacetate isomerase [Rhodoligotrophos defluvii]